MRRVLPLLVTFGIVAALGLGALAAPPTPAAGQSVTIVDFTFQPQIRTITPGDMVTWTNNGTVPHSATAVDKSFDTAIFQPGESKSATFMSVGTFLYYCQLHGTPDGKNGMVGTIVVAAATATPTCTATPPREAHLPIIQRPANTPTATATSMPTATPSATPTNGPPTPTKTPTLPPPSYNNCQADPNPGAALNYPVRIVSINKEAETVTLRNVTTGDTIDLTNWDMCSITGNQHHPIGGSLTPGETKTFVNTSGPIWNNSSSDPGALYNENGKLVSYFSD